MKMSSVIVAAEQEAAHREPLSDDEERKLERSQFALSEIHQGAALVADILRRLRPEITETFNRYPAKLLFLRRSWRVWR